MLGGGFAVLQALFVECFSFDPSYFQQDGLASSEGDIGGREVAKALVTALVIVVRDGRHRSVLREGLRQCQRGPRLNRSLPGLLQRPPTAFEP